MWPEQVVWIQEGQTVASHVLMLKPLPERGASPDSGADDLAVMKACAGCICIVSVPADPDVVEVPVIQAVSRQFAQEAGFPVTKLLDASLTQLCGPGTSASSVKALVRSTSTPVCCTWSVVYDCFWPWLHVAPCIDC
jgi:hypothetical protein